MFFLSNDKQFSFAWFIDSKYSNFHLYCCPKRIFLVETCENYSTILGLYSKSWDFPPRSWDFVPNPGTLFQILGLYSKSWDFTPPPWDFTPPPWDFTPPAWDFVPIPGTLLHHPEGEGGSRSLRSWSWIHKVLELDP